MTYVTYDNVSRRLVVSPTVYCVPTGKGFCTSYITIYSANRLVSQHVDTAVGDYCPRNPIKYDSANRRLYIARENVVCTDITYALSCVGDLHEYRD
jgi:hypothetical protein